MFLFFCKFVLSHLIRLWGGKRWAGERHTRLREGVLIRENAFVDEVRDRRHEISAIPGVGDTPAVVDLTGQLLDDFVGNLCVLIQEHENLNCCVIFFSIFYGF